jgi:SAM-dependent methyltransferase
VVRDPAGVPEGRPSQAAPITPAQARLLLSDEGREAVAFALTLDASDRLRAAEAVRPLGELGRLALDQALLKRRALAKHPDGDRLWWTAEALEQSTPRLVAEHHAARYGGEPVLDVGCSVGGDLLVLARRAPAVGVDLDPARLLLAQANVRSSGQECLLVRADATSLVPRGQVFADPARRSARGRRFDPAAWSPPLDLVLSWPATGLGVKVAPGIDYDALPSDLEVEVVSLDGDVKEAVLWGGSLRRGVARTATLLPSGAQLTSSELPTTFPPGGAGGGNYPPHSPPVAAPGRYVLDPDGAVVRAHLVAELAEQLDGWLLDSTIAYVSADVAAPTPYGRWFEVLETLPFSLKGLRERLRAYDAGPLTVKKRGTAVEPETLRKQLRLTGSTEATVILTRSQGRQIAMVVRPVA